MYGDFFTICTCKRCANNNDKLTVTSPVGNQTERWIKVRSTQNGVQNKTVIGSRSSVQRFVGPSSIIKPSSKDMLATFKLGFSPFNKGLNPFLKVFTFHDRN